MSRPYHDGQELIQCDWDGCPALWQHEVEIHGQDFKFCNHHLERIEPALITMLGVDDMDLVGSS